MDSLTQIILGAACGEAVLGKKIGNKALFFGAIGGTIPDLDVFIGPLIYGNEIQAMAFHRGFMHSVIFSIFGAFAFGWLTHRLYNKGKREGTTKLKDWRLLFFWSIFTHPVLDCFTPYGTQLFYPFLDYRVAFNTISVVDPLYTIPFLVSLIVLLFYGRGSKKRRLWLKMGIGISSLYMTFTFFNKLYVDSVYESSLKNSQIVYHRFQTQPTLFNNVLWYGVVETTSFYYVGFYSIFDKKATIDKWIKIEKQQNLIPMNDENLAKLAWFSNNYYTIESIEKSNEFIYKDLRYPLLNPDEANSSIFTFRIFNEDNVWDMRNSGPEFEENTSFSEMFSPMIKRLRGK